MPPFNSGLTLLSPPGVEPNGTRRGQLVTIRAGRYKPSKFDGLKKVGASGVNDDGVLILNGYYPTAAARLLFNLVYINEDSDWKLFVIEFEFREVN